MDDPFYFIQQPFSLLGDGENLKQDWFTHLDAFEAARNTAKKVGPANVAHEYDKYQNVTFNLWLFKGTHHFVQCLELLNFKYGTFEE